MSENIRGYLQPLEKENARLKAENDSLQAERAEAAETHARIMADECPTDEYHCTCVPALRAEIDALRNKINDLSKVSQDYEDTLRAARDTAEAEADQYKMQLSTALNECLDTVYRENSLVVALNKKDAEIELLKTTLAIYADPNNWISDLDVSGLETT